MAAGMDKAKDVGFELYTKAYGAIMAIVWLVNLRLYLQAVSSSTPLMPIHLDNGISSIVKILVFTLGFGGEAFMFVFIFAGCVLYFVSQYFREHYDKEENKKSKGHYKIVLLLSCVVFVLSAFLSPEYLLAIRKYEYVSSMEFVTFSIIFFTSVVGFMYGGSVVFRSKVAAENLNQDKFGNKRRTFPQMTQRIENAHSVNIDYEFMAEDGQYRPGCINVINQYRGNQVVGGPGSGKSYGFFLPAIEQNLKKGHSMLLYDFKYPDLSEHALTCLDVHCSQIKALRGKLPSVSSVYFDNVFYSSRINVLQPHMLKDFTLDAVNVAKVFMMALNPTWASKEGDFFVESAVNICASVVWALKIYKGGKHCTLPHVIELLALKTEDLINILARLEDDSLRNIIAPFKTAMEMGAGEQLSGQMGSVQIPLSRLASPTVYWVLTTEIGQEDILLDINLQEKYQVLFMGNSSERKNVNNIFYSLFIAQIFRMVNYKGRNPLSVFLDEVVTLSFPKGTIDTLIATGRSNQIAVWMGYQDLSQLYRDMTKDVGDVLFKMVGNTFAGNSQDETAEKLEKRFGQVRVNKRSRSVSVDEESSFSYSEEKESVVRVSDFSNMSQGTFAGQIADNFGEEIENKVFYGKVKYKPPYEKPKKMQPTAFWLDIFRQEGIDYSGFKPVVDIVLQQDENFKKATNVSARLMKENKDRIVADIEAMRSDLLG